MGIEKIVVASAIILSLVSCRPTEEPNHPLRNGNVSKIYSVPTPSLCAPETASLYLRGPAADQTVKCKDKDGQEWHCDYSRGGDTPFQCYHLSP